MLCMCQTTPLTCYRLCSLAVQLEHKHNEALATSKAHSQEVAKLQVRYYMDP